MKSFTAAPARSHPLSVASSSLARWWLVILLILTAGSHLLAQGPHLEVPGVIVNGGFCFNSNDGPIGGPCRHYTKTEDFLDSWEPPGTKDITFDDFPGCTVHVHYRTRVCDPFTDPIRQLWVTDIEIPKDGCDSLRSYLYSTNNGLGAIWHEAHLKVAGLLADDSAQFNSEFKCSNPGHKFVETRWYIASCARYDTVRLAAAVRAPKLDTTCVTQTWCCPPNITCPPDTHTVVGSYGHMTWPTSSMLDTMMVKVNDTTDTVYYFTTLYLGFSPYSFRRNLIYLGGNCWQFQECGVVQKRDSLGQLMYETAVPEFIPYIWKFACGEECCQVKTMACWDNSGVRHDSVIITPPPHELECVGPGCHTECPEAIPDSRARRIDDPREGEGRSSQPIHIDLSATQKPQGVDQ